MAEMIDLGAALTQLFARLAEIQQQLDSRLSALEHQSQNLQTCVARIEADTQMLRKQVETIRENVARVDRRL